MAFKLDDLVIDRIQMAIAEKTDGTENPRGGKFSCLISGGERRSEGFRAFLRRFLRTHGEEINILKNP